ncbi:MAG: hypothetical protein GY943_39075, partial [Chloroflexi bacterium]|nr:hypothetical protein [Chloroflexota bacterium]
MINSTQILLRDDLSEAYALTNPASAELYASDFDEDIVHTVSRMDDVAVADARRSFTMQV